MSNESLPEPANPILDAIEAAEAIPDPLAGLVEQTYKARAQSVPLNRL